MTEDLELREFVATRLMGWAARNTASELGRMFERAGSYPTPLRLLPAYETDWAAMGLVIEAMRAKGYVIGHVRWDNLYLDPKWAKYGKYLWHASFAEGDAYADSAPLAVARAARAAMEAM